MRRIFSISVLMIAVSLAGGRATAESFNFQAQLFGPASTLAVNPENIDPGTGLVSFNGGDGQSPSTPFTWNWGDGQEESGWFPSQHTYADTSRNYLVTVTAHYAGGLTDTKESLVRFVAPQINPISLPANLAVTIPDQAVTLDSRMAGYSPPATLTYFTDSHFSTTPRASLAYVLSAAASIQQNLANGNVAIVAGGFPQVLLRDPGIGGMYSLWYTSPVAMGAGEASLQGLIQYSSLFHEMGHNVTLNSPASFYYGGKIDGPANAIFSETMAQIFQHATAYQLINQAAAYGLSEDLAHEIKISAISSMELVRRAYDAYVQGGAVFHSWNDPATPQDETFNTFMTIAYQFFVLAENSGQGYETPLQRMMHLLENFDEDWAARYDPQNDNDAADSFRATLMVAALSYGFDTDLRPEFTALNFPLDDTTYNQLIQTAQVPVPGAGWLFAAGLLGLALKRTRRKP